MRTAQLGKKKSQGNFFSIYNSLMGGNEVVEIKLFSVVPTDRKRGNGYKLKHMKFYLITRKLFFFFYYESDQNWNRLPRECVQPHLWRIKTQLDTVLDNLL